MSTSAGPAVQTHGEKEKSLLWNCLVLTASHCLAGSKSAGKISYSPLFSLLLKYNFCGIFGCVDACISCTVQLVWVQDSHLCCSYGCQVAFRFWCPSGFFFTAFFHVVVEHASWEVQLLGFGQEAKNPCWLWSTKHLWKVVWRTITH